MHFTCMCLDHFGSVNLVILAYTSGHGYRKVGSYFPREWILHPWCHWPEAGPEGEKDLVRNC